jgi:tetratricopeptide (TPR) repeat protein
VKSVWTKFAVAYSLIGLLLSLGSAGALAASAAWEVCKGPNPEQSIAACSDLLTRQAEEPGVPRAEILKQRARSFINSHSRRDKAIPDLTEVIALTPGDLEALAMRAEANEAAGNHLAALKDYDAALGIDPNFKQTRNQYTFSLRLMRKSVAEIVDPLWKQCGAFALLSTAEGINACTKIIERGEAESQFGRAEAYKQRATIHGTASIFSWGANERALADLNQALRLIPNDIEALRQRGEHFFVWGRYKEAISDLDHAKAIDPRNPDILGLRGRVYADIGEQERADAEYKELARVDPDNFALKLKAQLETPKTALFLQQTPYSRISSMCIFTNKVPDEQIAACTEALKQVPEGLPSRADLFKARATAYSAAGNHEAAIGDFDEAIRVNAQDVALLVRRGDAKAAAGRQAEADADYRAALRIDEPEKTEPQREIDMPLLRCISATGKPGQTIESCTAVLNRGDALSKARRITALNRRSDAYYWKATEFTPLMPTADQPRDEAKAKEFNDKGQNDLQTIIEIDPSNKDVPARLAALKNLFPIAGQAGLESWECQMSREPDVRIKRCSTNIASPGAATAGQQAEWLRSRADAYLDKRETDLAIADIDAAERLEPNRKANSELRIRAYERKGDYKRALEEFDRAAELSPKEFYQYRRDQIEDRADPAAGRCLRSYEVTEEQRIKACTALLARQPADSPARRKAIYERRARAYGYRQPDKYIEDLTSAIEIAPKDVKLLLDRARAYLDQNKDGQAFADFNNAAELEPYNSDVFVERGRAYSLRREDAKAQTDYERAVKLNPESERAHEEIVRLKEAKIERVERQARKETPHMKTCTAPFRRAAPDSRIAACTTVLNGLSEAEQPEIEFHSDRAMALAWRGWAYHEKGDEDQALVDLNDAVDKAPRIITKNSQGAVFSLASLLRGLVYLSTNEPERAAPDLALARDGQPDLVAGVLANFYFDRKNYSSALAELNKQLQKNPNNVRASLLRGLVYLSTNEPERAAPDLALARDSQPDLVAESLANFHFNRQNYSSALAELNKQLEKNPNNILAYSMRGRTYLAMGQHQQARDDCGKAVELSAEAVNARKCLEEAKKAPGQ